MKVIPFPQNPNWRQSTKNGNSEGKSFAAVLQAMIPTYKCEHHKWEYWHHYDDKMPEGGCKLSKEKFACKFLDASKCPLYVPKKEKK